MSSGVSRVVWCLVFEDVSKVRWKALTGRHVVTITNHSSPPFPNASRSKISFLWQLFFFFFQFHSKFNAQSLCSFSTKHRRRKIKLRRRVYYLALRHHSGAWFGIQMGEGSAVTIYIYFRDQGWIWTAARTVLLFNSHASYILSFMSIIVYLTVMVFWCCQCCHFCSVRYDVLELTNRLTFGWTMWSVMTEVIILCQSACQRPALPVNVLQRSFKSFIDLCWKKLVIICTGIMNDVKRKGRTFALCLVTKAHDSISDVFLLSKVL